MEESKGFPPRVSIEMGVDGLLSPRVSSYVFKPFPAGNHEYLSRAESDALVRAARAEERVKTLTEVLENCSMSEGSVEWVFMVRDAARAEHYQGFETRKAGEGKAGMKNKWETWLCEKCGVSHAMNETKCFHCSHPKAAGSGE